MKKHIFLTVVSLLALSLFVTACGGGAQVVEKVVTVEVEKVVTVEVPVEVEKIVTVEVEAEMEEAAARIVQNCLEQGDSWKNSVMIEEMESDLERTGFVDLLSYGWFKRRTYAGEFGLKKAFVKRVLRMGE